MPNPHVDGENGKKKTIVYNTKGEIGKEKKEESTRTSPRILFLQR